jgi:NDMA-dependent alcohol dehydrogenase
MKTKAAVLYQPRTPLVIEELDLDEPKQGEVLIKVGAAGICRSDWHFMAGEAHVAVPVVLGHEGAGIVERLGPGVASVKPGDHVILSFVSRCGKCFYCTTGKPNLCDAHMATSTTMLDGTHRLHKGKLNITPLAKLACFSQYSVVPEAACVPCPKELPLDKGAVIGCCVTTGVSAAITAARVEPGSTVAVVGCGGVGLNVIQGARLANASRIIAVDIGEGKLEFAMQFGATHIVNPSYQDAVARVKEITEGRGADYTFEVFGSGDTVEMAFNMARKGGTVTVVGIAPDGDMPSIDAVALVRQEKTLKGSYYGSARMHADMPKMVELYMSGRLNLDALVTRTYSLEEINKAYEDLLRGEVGRGVITRF